MIIIQQETVEETANLFWFTQIQYLRLQHSRYKVKLSQISKKKKILLVMNGMGEKEVFGQVFPIIHQAFNFIHHGLLKHVRHPCTTGLVQLVQGDVIPG